MAATGVLAILAAAVQPGWVPEPEADLGRYLGLWMGVAAASLVAAGAEMSWRAVRAGPGLARQMTIQAAEQFLPCVAIGALLTLCIARYASQSAWMLPGLWAMVFSLGVFASRRILPRPVVWAGFYYAGCGCASLAWGQGVHAYSPWQMALTFGGGQMLAAVILYRTLERLHVSEADA